VSPPPQDHETRDLISKQGYSALQRALLIPLQEIAYDLTSYQAGSVAAAQIISNGKYVLEDPRQIKKFQADLDYFMAASDNDNLGIRDLQRITWDDISRLLKFLKTKAYEERNIKAGLGKKRSDREAVSSLSRASLKDLSEPTRDLSALLLAKLKNPKIAILRREYWPGHDRNPLFTWGHTQGTFIPGLILRNAYAKLLTGEETFSPELINSIAKEEKLESQRGNGDDVFELAGIKADGGPEHIEFVLDRLIDLTRCLRSQFHGDEYAETKIDSAIENIYEVRVRIDGPGPWRSFFPGSVEPDVNLRPVLEKITRGNHTHTVSVPEGISVRKSLLGYEVNDAHEIAEGYEPGLTLRRTFAKLLTGRETFSTELINSIAEVESIAKEKPISAAYNDPDVYVFKDTGIKADGGTDHIAFILERLLDLQSCLGVQFKENETAVTKITAAITNEQLGNVKEALKVTTQ
jgi:hypothetical protein